MQTNDIFFGVARIDASIMYLSISSNSVKSSDPLRISDETVSYDIFDAIVSVCELLQLWMTQSIWKGLSVDLSNTPSISDARSRA